MTVKWHLTIVSISYMYNINLKCKFDATEPNNRPQKSFTDCSPRHIESTVQSLYFLSWTTVRIPPVRSTTTTNTRKLYDHIHLFVLEI